MRPTFAAVTLLLHAAQAQTSVNATPPAADTNSSGLSCKALPSWGGPVGIVLGSFASVGINIGQNMQADGIKLLPLEEQMMPWKSRVWVIGESVFIGCSIVNFAALGLAPASVLVPLESIQFVTNVAYSRIVHKANVPPKMLLGVFLSVVGTVFTVVFGAAGDSCHTLEQLEWAWTSPIWWSYLAVTIGIAVACLRIHKSYEEQLKAGGSPKARARAALPHRPRPAPCGETARVPRVPLAPRQRSLPVRSGSRMHEADGRRVVGSTRVASEPRVRPADYLHALVGTAWRLADDCPIQGLLGAPLNALPRGHVLPPRQLCAAHGAALPHRSNTAALPSSAAAAAVTAAAAAFPAVPVAPRCPRRPLAPAAASVASGASAPSPMRTDATPQPTPTAPRPCRACAQGSCTWPSCW
jgi:hypothetical protein